VALIIVGWLVLYQFRDSRQEAAGDLMASMPFTRRQIIFTKWVTGVMAIAVPFVVIFLLLTVFYWVNTEWISTPFRLLPQWATLYFLFLACFYSFMFFVQTVMGHPGIASVIGVICTMIPWYLLSAIPVILRQLLGLNYGDAALLDGIERLGEYTVWTRWVRPRYEYLFPDWTTHQLIYTHYGLKVISMVAVIVLFYWLAQQAYAKNPLEKNGKLLMFRFLEPVLIWGFAVCLGMLIVFLFGLGYGSGFFGLVLYLVAGTAIGYWLAKKAVLYYQG
jgi:ABC-type transport system involved in multi-copper enzyme maturation permease subunit